LTSIDSTLSTINLPSENIRIKIDFPFKKVSDEPFVVAGYASIEQIDKQYELIKTGVLKEAWDRCYQDGRIRTHLMHTGITVGDIIPEFTEKNGTKHTTGVDDVGLYIVSTVWDNTQKALETRDLIMRGVLRGYSIGGEVAGPKDIICNGDFCYANLSKLDLHEISYVDKPANPDSVFRLLKRDDEEVMSMELPDFIRINKELILKPIPKPITGESQDDYIPRCHSAIADEYKDRDQRNAICFNTWRESKKNDHSLLSYLLMMIPELPEDIRKCETCLVDEYDIFLIKRHPKKKNPKDECEEEEKKEKSLELHAGAVQSDDRVNIDRKETDSASDLNKRESKKIKIKVVVK